MRGTIGSPLVSFSTLACPEWSWDEILSRGAAYGYDGVEVRLIQREVDLLAAAEFRPGELPRRRRELAQAGFRVCGLGSSVRFDEPAAGHRREQVATGCRYLDLAAELQASFVRVFGDVLPGGGSTEKRDAIDQIAEGLNRLGEHAAPLGLHVLIETHGDFADSTVVADTMFLVDSPAVGVLWDTHHPWRFCGETLDATCRRIGRWVRHTHWKDSVSQSRRADCAASRAAASEAHSLMSGHQHADYVLFGDGEFPADECLALLQASGYAGWLSYEWEKAWHPDIESPETALPPFPALIRKKWQATNITGD